MRKIKTPKKESIYYRFLKLLVVAFAAASLFFFLLNRSGTVLLQSYFTKTSYMERENQRRVEDFRDYVTKNNLATTDMEKLTEWVSRQSVVWMQIYRDHILLYDSQFPYMKANPEFHVKGQFYEWESYRVIYFQDGPAQVFLTGMYTYQFYNYALIVEFFLSFLLFTGIIMAGIRSSMKYIRTLSTEIGILEGGNLDYKITVAGNDEMTVLAKGLDSMRMSIRGQIRQEAELIRLNQSMITSLSHDLRTPLTALIIYTEILKSGIDASREQMQSWVCKIDEKAHQIKNMADCILEYSLQKKTAETGSISQKSLKDAFSSPLAETCAYLEERGFNLKTALSWEDREVSVDGNYVIRIFDNISSNIIKYASRNAPVRITSFYDSSCCGFLFENVKLRGDAVEEPADSNGIGIRNVQTMMAEMGGRCSVEESEELYRIRWNLLRHANSVNRALQEQRAIDSRSSAHYNEADRKWRIKTVCPTYFMR